MKVYCSSCFLSVWNGYLLLGKLTCAFWPNFTKQRWNFKWKWWCFEILLKGYKITSLTSKGRNFNEDFRMNFWYWLTVIVVHLVFAVGLLFDFAKLPRPPWSTIAPERKRRWKVLQICCYWTWTYIFRGTLFAVVFFDDFLAIPSKLLPKFWVTVKFLSELDRKKMLS